MNCTDTQNSLVGYLMDELDAAEQLDVELHLATGCESCCAELTNLTESMEMLWQAVPSQPLPIVLREQVLARCLNSPTSSCQQQTFQQSATLGSPSSGKFMGAMLLAFAAGILLMYAMHQLTQEHDAPIFSNPLVYHGHQPTTGRLGTGDTPETLELSGRPYSKSHFVALHRHAKNGDLSGQLLWDRLSREIHIYCFGLSAPLDGWRYTVWMVGPHQTVRIVDELKVDATGDCQAVAHWPVGEFQYVQVALSRIDAHGNLSPNEITLTSDAIPAND